ncbi:hypothetical protein ES708_07302 [subsurface metagenome]
MGKKRHLLSYLAGVFDGEGCIYISKAKRPLTNYSPHYTLKATVVMTDEIIPMLFLATFGGAFRTEKPSRSNAKMLYRWEVCTLQAVAFLKDILPFSLLKRPQIEVGLHFAGQVRGYFETKTRLTEEELAVREADFILLQNLKREGTHV